MKAAVFLIFFLLLQKEYANQMIYDQECLFFNILYISVQRSQATIEYFTDFIEFDDSLSKLHKQVLSKMRNPSKADAVDLIKQYEEKQIQYNERVKKTLDIYNCYKYLLNNYVDKLHDKKDILQKLKKKIATNLLKELFNLENIIMGVRNFFSNLETLDSRKYAIMEYKNIFTDISNNLSLYLYYQKMYVAFDNLLISQYDYFMKMKYLFNSYYKEFWIAIEKQRLAETINIYNFYMHDYFERHSDGLKKMIFNEEKSEMILDKEYLPVVLYNKFL